MRIRIVTPLTTAGFTSPDDVEFVGAAGTEVSQVSIDFGPASVECELEIALSAPDTVAKVCDAAADGCAAVVIDCMSDPGLAAAREAVDIPVIGASQAAMHVAALLAHSF
jgi:allantoin racemase